MHQDTQPTIRQQGGLSTDELAALLSLKPQTLRARLCTAGDYFGLRPAKLPNGRLVWPADSLERLSQSTKAEA